MSFVKKFQKLPCVLCGKYPSFYSLKIKFQIILFVKASPHVKKNNHTLFDAA